MHRNLQHDCLWHCMQWEKILYSSIIIKSHILTNLSSLAWHSGVHPWPWICACRHQSLQPSSVLHQPQSGLFQAFHMFNRSLLPWLYSSNCRDIDRVCKLQDYTELLLLLIGVPVICNVRNYLSYFFFPSVNEIWVGKKQNNLSL